MLVFISFLLLIENLLLHLQYFSVEFALIADSEDLILVFKVLDVFF